MCAEGCGESTDDTQEKLEPVGYKPGGVTTYRYSTDEQ